MVLEVDTNQRRLSLGLKASYFTDAGDAVEDDAQVRFDQLKRMLRYALISACCSLRVCLSSAVWIPVASAYKPSCKLSSGGFASCTRLLAERQWP